MKERKKEETSWVHNTLNKIELKIIRLIVGVSIKMCANLYAILIIIGILAIITLIMYLIINTLIVIWILREFEGEGFVVLSPYS